MPPEEESPPVACTITEERAAARADWMADTLVPAFTGASELENGVTVRFAGTTETLSAVARFVAEEQQCCAFADYRIDVSPPYDETRLTITGPDGTRAMFVDEFVPRLGGDAPLTRPD